MSEFDNTPMKMKAKEILSAKLLDNDEITITNLVNKVTAMQEAPHGDVIVTYADGETSYLPGDWLFFVQGNLIPPMPARGFYLDTPHGTVHVLGDPNMSAEQLETLKRIVEAAVKKAR